MKFELDPRGPEGAAKLISAISKSANGDEIKIILPRSLKSAAITVATATQRTLNGQGKSVEVNIELLDPPPAVIEPKV